MKLHLDRKYTIEQTDYIIRILENGKTVLYQDNDFSSKFTRDSYGNPLTYQDSKDFSSEWTRDSKGNELTFQDSTDFSYEYTRDNKGNPLTYKNSNGYSSEYTRDNKGNPLTYKNSYDDSYEWTYDNKGNELTYTVNGVLIRDNRVKKVTLELTQEQLDKIKHLLEGKKW